MTRESGDLSTLLPKTFDGRFTAPHPSLSQVRDFSFLQPMRPEHVKPTKKIALAGLLSSLAVAMGFLFLAVPNVELMTLIVFVSGGLLGARGGALVGIVSMFIYSLANPMGAAIPLVTVAQVVGLGVVGAAGSVSPMLRRTFRKGVARSGAFACFGVLLTVQYDLLTNLALGISVGGVLVVVAGGLLFSLVHFVSNALIFFFLADVLLSFEGRT